MFKASVIQAAPVMFDREATVAKVRILCAQAAQQNTQLVVFPEAFVSSYPKGLVFGARVGGRTPEGRRMFRRYCESGVYVPGPAVDALAAIAREHALFMV